MRAAIAYSLSAFVHAVVLGGLAVWTVNSLRYEQYSFAAGQPITLEFSPASPAAQPAAIVVAEAETLPEPSVPVEPLRTEIEIAPRPVKLERQVALVEVAQRSEQEQVEAAESPPTEASPRRAEMQAEKPDDSDAPTRKIVRKATTPADADADASAVEVQFQAASQAGLPDQLPRHLPSNPAPLYPPDALLRSIEGRVILRVVVATDGSVATAAVDTSSGSASLDNSAMTTVQRWRFQPASRGGQSVTFEILVPVKFRIIRG